MKLAPSMPKPPRDLLVLEDIDFDPHSTPRNTIAIGTTQQAGKSTTMLAYDIVPWMEAETGALIVCDPDGSLARNVAGYALERGMDDRLIIIDLNRPQVAGFGFITRSSATDPLQRESENRYFARCAGEAMSLHRGQSIDDTRVIKEWVFVAVQAWQEQPNAIPEQEMISFLRPWTSQFDILVSRLPVGPLKDKLLSLKEMYKQRSQFWKDVGPALRLLEETYSEPRIRQMLIKTFDLEKAIEDKAIIVIVGCEDAYVNRYVMKSVVFRVVGICTSHHAKTGEPLSVRIVMDEMNRLVSMPEADAMNRTVKKGVEFLIMGQTQFFGDDFVDEMVEAGCTEKIIMHCSSEAVSQKMAAHLRLMSDPHKIKRTSTKIVMKPSGDYDTIPTVNKGESYLPDGSIRTNKTEGASHRMRYLPVEETDDEYYSLNEQDILHEIAPMELSVGQFYRRFGNKVSGPHYVPKLDKPFLIDGLMEDYIELHVQKLVAQGILRTPTAGKPWQPSQPPPEFKGNGSQKQNGNDGTRKSPNKRRPTR